jgi:hypothetical protein
MTLTANFEFPPSRDYHIDVSRYEIYCTKKIIVNSTERAISEVFYRVRLMSNGSH